MSNSETRIVGGRPMTFRDYKAEVSTHIAGAVGVGLDDLTDYNIWDAWDSGTPPAEAAREAFENDVGGMFFGEDMEELIDMLFG
jgi:hypothetical protein